MKKLFQFFLFVVLVSCSTNQTGEFVGFIDPDSETYVNLMPYIRESFYYRKQAIIEVDISAIYDRYPALSKEIDLDKGINIKGIFVRNMQSFEIIDGNIFPEFYEKIKLMETDGEIRKLVHGMELYLRQNDERGLSESGGEFKLVVYLRKDANNFEIYRTDEVTSREWKEESDLN